MEYTMNKYGCGCKVIRDGAGAYFIEYCSKHGAAPIMHGQLETGKDALLEALNDINGGRMEDAKARITGVRAGNDIALAKANPH